MAEQELNLIHFSANEVAEPGACPPEIVRGQPLDVREKPSALLRRQPVAQPHAETAHALQRPNTRGEFRAQESGIGCFVRHAAHGGEPKD